MGAELVRVEPANLVVPALPAAALGRLPVAVGVDADPYWRLAAAFLVGYQGHSRLAYFSDLKAWHGWCVGRGTHPLAVERHHVDTWITHLTETAQPRTGRPASPATIARRLSCLSKFYEYAVRDAELLDVSPMARVRRPRVDDDSATVGLDRDELGRLLGAAEDDGPRATALVSLLIYNGLRISEALTRDIEHFTYQTGHRVLRLTRKGGKRSTEALAPVTVHALETYIGDRAGGPIFLGRNGADRLTRSGAWRLIRRLARNAGIPAASQLSPHSLRHSFATGLLGAGVPLQDVQDAMGHADPRTTRAYDRSRHRLDNHATYAMAAWLRRGPGAAEEQRDR
jgi:integrase/recombinase XerD